jgi:hypothetical protein
MGWDRGASRLPIGLAGSAIGVGGSVTNLPFDLPALKSGLCPIVAASCDLAWCDVVLKHETNASVALQLMLKLKVGLLVGTNRCAHPSQVKRPHEPASWFRDGFEC